MRNLTNIGPLFAFILVRIGIVILRTSSWRGSGSGTGWSGGCTMDCTASTVRSGTAIGPCGGSA